MEPIAAPIQTVLDLFATDLADVRFADVDAKTLERVASEVKSAAEVVASAEVALDVARAALQEKQDVLLQHSQRALAYARVYAESDEAISARLETIVLPRPMRRTRNGTEAIESSAAIPPSPRIGRRTRKAPANEPMLDGVTLSGE
jgi:hypothetical protein